MADWTSVQKNYVILTTQGFHTMYIWVISVRYVSNPVQFPSAAIL